MDYFIDKLDYFCNKTNNMVFVTTSDNDSNTTSSLSRLGPTTSCFGYIFVAIFYGIV